MMKRFRCIFLLVVVLFSFASCEKDDDANGAILVTAKADGQAIQQAAIYLKRGASPDTIVPPTSFDKQSGADGLGQVYFDNLEPDTYTLFAKGHSSVTHKLVTGKTIVQVYKRTRQNYYEITVEAK